MIGWSGGEHVKCKKHFDFAENVFDGRSTFQLKSRVKAYSKVKLEKMFRGVVMQGTPAPRDCSTRSFHQRTMHPKGLHNMNYCRT